MYIGHAASGGHLGDDVAVTSAVPGLRPTNIASVTPTAAVAAGSTVGASTVSSLDLGCVQLLMPLPAWSATSSFWPDRIVTA